MELNRVERRALAVASALVVLGAAVRVGVGPHEATWAWRSDDAGAGLDSMRARVEAEISRAERIATPMAAGERLDPNSAPAEELQRLSGIGPRKAAAIVEERLRNPILSAEDLLRVPGLGPATVERLRPHLRFGAATTTGASRRRTTWAENSAGRLSPGRSPHEPLDLNHAGTAQLEQLPGIGPARARAIVAHRASHGPFRSIEDLTAVRGIGPELLKRLRPHVRVR